MTDHQSYGGHRPESFERVYQRTVAVNEGCGCAELMVRHHPTAGSSSSGVPSLLGLLGLLFSLLRRLRNAVRRGAEN
jgi:phytoene/squalene synthetase